jgi:hypothetical protein
LQFNHIAGTNSADRSQNPHLLRALHRETIPEFINARATFEVFKQCPHRDARRVEKPLAATLAGSAFDRSTFRPIEHAVSPGSPMDHDKITTLCLRPRAGLSRTCDEPPDSHSRH